MSDRARGSGRRRERLASPLALASAGAAFAVAFALLAPSPDAFVVEAPANEGAGAVPLDELRLAYLKARGAAGELDAAEAFASVTTLAGEGRVAEARALLAASPALSLGPGERVRLDLELAAGEVRRAEARVAASDGAAAERSAEEGVAAARAGLARALRRLLDRRSLYGPALLERGAALAASTGDRRLPAAFHERLADVDPARAVDHLAACGNGLAASGLGADAIDCLERARALADDPVRRFELALRLLPILPPGDLDGRRRALVDEMPGDRAASGDRLEALATVLLAIERPDAAARVYARLAETDASGRARWLEAAARWSEAAGRPDEAAVFLDAMPVARDAGTNAARRRRIEALLVGAGREREALEKVAGRVAVSPADPDAVRDAVALARRTGDDARALGWNTTLLAVRPDDEEALRRQIALALGVGRPDLAREAAERALAAAPDDAALLAELARLSEWSGAPERALRHRRRLAELDAVPDATSRADTAGGTGAASTVDRDANLVEIVRLAEAVRRPAVGAEALRELARRRPPDEARVRRLVRLYELDGRPDAASAALEEIMERHGERTATLRTLAELERRHVRFRPALGAWTRLAALAGRSAEETLARTELLWRLGEPEAAAALAADLPALGFASAASDYQTSLLAEIGWRYRLPAVAALARPLLASLEAADRRLVHARRAVDALETAGDLAGASREAEALWRAIGEPELGLTALRLAIDGGDDAAAERLLADTARDDGLLALPGYHALRATDALRRGDADAARRAYETALGLDADSVEAIAGLLWLHIGEGDTARLAELLEREAVRAADEDGLWVAFAVGHVEIGDAAGSLPWFERALGTDGHGARTDYGLILTWADALESAGRLDHARRVRRFAVAELRPGLIDGAGADRETLLRQYGRVLARHGGSEANESWMRYVLASGEADAAGGGFWREDMAIAWLMATERHEHARLLMARRHERRLAAPLWQDLALAMRADDEASVRAMLEAGTGLSAGDRILALREVGREADAWTLALRTLGNARTPADRAVAREQHAAMKRFRPSHATALTRRGTRGDLVLEERGVALRHTLGASALGFGIDYTRSELDSERLVVAGTERSSVAVSLFREGPRQRFGIGLGVLDDGATDRSFGDARYTRRDPGGRREATIDLAWNESADESAELRIAGVRDRAGLAMESSVGERAYLRLSAEASEIRTRVNDRRLARGLATRAELGLRGGFGGIAWSGSVVASDVRRDRVERLPLELRLGQGTTFDTVLPASASSVSLNGSLSRGGVGADFPDVASPRYYLNGGLAHAWPERAFGLQLDAGVGVRVLGNDELALAFVRDARLAGRRTKADLTSIGLSYRRHF